MDNRIPPPLVATLFGLLAWLAAGHLPGALELTLEWRLGLALVVLLAGAAVSLGGVLCFRRARTTVNPLKPQAATALVRPGVYRYTRNPMYLGFAMALTAWSIFLAWPPALLGFVAYMNRFQIGPQERALAVMLFT
ncbi:isoprenylcysteine carboxylmethyltransferase family protein [Pseudomonas fakonensis]|uniref:Isoprenylcysteine carboxylmethyltransferase family protein n=1 Tax=Pseudomonas fakonensis TaxID=2842355 RepID=A0ABX8NC88_9PSED|nr:methyltransferase [Pseudomonas fakonensis]QXH53485.1 isoprenylcysteine carboxylmethyltransferase family protein [Pseudomonas fakonensis]